MRPPDRQSANPEGSSTQSHLSVGAPTPGERPGKISDRSDTHGDNLLGHETFGHPATGRGGTKIRSMSSGVCIEDSVKMNVRWCDQFYSYSNVAQPSDESVELISNLSGSSPIRVISLATLCMLLFTGKWSRFSAWPAFTGFRRNIIDAPCGAAFMLSRDVTLWGNGHTVQSRKTQSDSSHKL